MILGIFGSIWEEITEFAGKVKDFILNNSRNPVVWIGIIIVALFIFEFVYKKLHKD